MNEHNEMSREFIFVKSDDFNENEQRALRSMFLDFIKAQEKHIEERKSDTVMKQARYFNIITAYKAMDFLKIK